MLKKKKVQLNKRIPQHCSEESGYVLWKLNLRNEIKIAKTDLLVWREDKYVTWKLGVTQAIVRIRVETKGGWYWQDFLPIIIMRLIILHEIGRICKEYDCKMELLHK